MGPRSRLHSKEATDILSQALNDIDAVGNVWWGGASVCVYSSLVVGHTARLQRLADLQGHLDEAPFKRMRQLLDQFQTLAVPERRHVRHA